MGDEVTKHSKSLRKLYQLCKDGHVQKISITKGSNVVFVVCICLRKVRKDRMYKTFIRSDKQQPVFNTTSYPGSLLGVPNKDPEYDLIWFDLTTLFKKDNT